MQLTRYEQETIINFNEEEKTASVYTCNAALRRKLDKLTEERPDDCKAERTSRDGQATEYILPKSWVKITPTRILSEAQREAARKAMKKANLARNAPRAGTITN